MTAERILVVDDEPQTQRVPPPLGAGVACRFRGDEG